MDPLKYQTEFFEIEYDTIRGMEYAPVQTMGDTSYFTLFSPVDCIIDKTEVRTIRTGISLKLPVVVDQRKSTNVINVSKYSIGALVAPHSLMTDNGLVHVGSSFVIPGLEIDLVFQNHGKKSFMIKKGFPIANLTFVMVPNVHLVPRMMMLNVD